MAYNVAIEASGATTALVVDNWHAPTTTKRMKTYNGSAWVEGTPKIWDGGAWVSATAKAWDGGAWV